MASPKRLVVVVVQNFVNPHRLVFAFDDDQIDIPVLGTAYRLYKSRINLQLL